jgi:hypothetical protein
LTSVLLNQLPLPDLPETLTTSFVFLPRVHPITMSHGCYHIYIGEATVYKMLRYAELFS